jgi:ribosomal protein L4
MHNSIFTNSGAISRISITGQKPMRPLGTGDRRNLIRQAILCGGRIYASPTVKRLTTSGGVG